MLLLFQLPHRNTLIRNNGAIFYMLVHSFLLCVFSSDRFKVVVYARYGMCRRVRVHERIHTFVVLLLGSCLALLSLPLGNAVCCFVFVFLHFI